MVGDDGDDLAGGDTTTSGFGNWGSTEAFWEDEMGGRGFVGPAIARPVVQGPGNMVGVASFYVSFPFVGLGSFIASLRVHTSNLPFNFLTHCTSFLHVFSTLHCTSRRKGPDTYLAKM